MELTDEQIEKIKRIPDIPDFPYPTFHDLKQATARQEVVVGAAMDTARQWIAADGAAPKLSHMLLTALAFMYFVFPLTLIVATVITGNWGWLIYLLPLFFSLMVLRPMTVRTAPFLKLIIFFGYGAILAHIFNFWEQWSLLLGLSIIAPWLVNRITYRHATDVAIREGLKSEHRFVQLFKYNVLALNFPNGDMVWGYDLVRRKQSNVQGKE